MMMNNRWVAAIVALAAIALWGEARAAYVYSTPGELYEQNFDSLPNTPANSSSLGSSPNGWIDNTTTPGSNQFSIPGWYLRHVASQTEGGANGKQRFRVGHGNGTTGAFYSFGAHSSGSGVNTIGSTERALGTLPAATLADTGESMRIGLRITNNTGITLTSFTVTYDGEQWHDGASTSSLNFSYGIDLPEATWDNVTGGAVPGSVTFVSALTFAAPVANHSGTGGVEVDGNGVGKVAGITATIDLPETNLWLPGTDLWLRWSQIQVANLSDDGLAIDNVRFSATGVVVPEPASILLVALAGLGMAASRRKR